MTSSKTAPKVHVLLPVHNRRAVTEGFVKCLAAQTYANWHLLLIDDGSNDGTADVVRAVVPSATILRGTGSWWWAGSLQQGQDWLVRHAADDDIILMVNDDTFIGPGFLQAAVRVLKPDSVLLAQLYSINSRSLVEAGVNWNPRELRFAGVTDIASINCFSTRGLFMRVHDMKRIGGFHPRLLPHYLSDYEYTIRAQRKGFLLDSSPEVALYYDDTSEGRELGRQTLFRGLRRLFSRKSPHNPVYWTSFVVLACPSAYIPANIVRVWYRFYHQVRNMLGPAPGADAPSSGRV